MASSKTVTLAKYGLTAALGAAATLTLTTLTATTITSTTVNVGTLNFSDEAGSSTGVILCVRSTGAVGRCAGGGTGSGTRVCSTCSAL